MVCTHGHSSFFEFSSSAYAHACIELFGCIDTFCEGEKEMCLGLRESLGLEIGNSEVDFCNSLEGENSCLNDVQETQV